MRSKGLQPGDHFVPCVTGVPPRTWETYRHLYPGRANILTLIPLAVVVLPVAVVRVIVVLISKAEEAIRRFSRVRER